MVHLSAGLAALAGATVLGRRKSHLAGQQHFPARIPYVILGTGMLWFGWFGFNAGSALAANATAVTAFATTNTASAAAMMAWVFLEWMRGQKPSAVGACIGAVVGLVAITPAAGFVSIPASLVIGVAASAAATWRCTGARSPSSTTPRRVSLPRRGRHRGHGVTAVFAQDGGLIGGSPLLLLKHLGGPGHRRRLHVRGAWLLYRVTNLITPLRVDERHEQLGLDLSQHGESLSMEDLANAE